MDLIFAVGWEGFIIPAIAFVIWVISSLASNKNAPQNPKAGAKNLGPGNQAPLSDIDRFFQEAKQRRAKVDPVSKASLYVEPAVPKVKRRPASKDLVVKSKNESVPVSFFVDQSEINIEPFALPMQPPVVKKMAGDAEPLPATISKNSKRKFGSKTSPLISEALALLKGPKVIGSALVLQEILLPPLCMRRRQPR